MSVRPTNAHSNRWWRRAGPWLVFGLLMAGFGWLYVSSSSRIIEQAAGRPLNPLEQRHLALVEASRGDQHPDFTRSFSEPLKQWLPHRADGFVQPMWPWIAAWMWDPGTGNPTGELVYHAGWLRLGMILGFLLVLGITCMRSFSLPAAVLIVVLIGMHGLQPTLAEFHGGTLYVLLFLLIWPASIYGLQRNSLWVYGVIGILGGLAYLTDERVLVVLMVFVLVSTLRAAWGWLVAHWPRGEGTTTLWVRRNHVFGLLLLLTLFVFIAGPRLVESQETLGHPFSSRWQQMRWLDDPQTAAAWVAQTSALSPAASDAGSGERQLSLGGYSARHSREAMTQRLGRGFGEVLGASLHRGGAFLGALTVLLGGIWMAVLLAAPKAHHAWHRLHPETATVALFVVASVTAHVVIAAWDAAVMDTTQALLPIESAVALSLVWACESLLRRAQRRGASRLVFAGYQISLWAIVGVAGWQAIQGLQPAVSVP